MVKNNKQEVHKEHSHEENEHLHEHDNQAEMYEYQLMSQQMQQLQQTFNTMNKHRDELRRLESNLQDLSKLKGGETSMIPLGSGIYIKGKVEKSDNVYMNVGSGVVLQKSYDSALDTIRKQLAEVDGFAIQVEQNIQQVSIRIQELQHHMQEHNHEH